MARYSVTHVCGHTEDHQLFGKSKDRDRKITWMEGTDCTACYRAKQDAARAQANAAAAEANAANGLAALVGSDKQIAWAESIRKPVIETAAILTKDVVDDVTEDGLLSAAAIQEIKDCLALIEQEYRTQASAKWWIDNRGEIAIVPVKQFRARRDELCPTAAAEARAHAAAKEASHG